ncbi:hypothetical protein K1T71_002235 [Dendrolimus kikuchii]|uniref:Uncharacterized protein n=1 Tax=Dendrolimus kikuchii TaxID=765133 RepID=A0ACC1DHL0_9NEOP|nr:hypothetical protein K1T71_002235 [Dendrolimus kikuchii]
MDSDKVKIKKLRLKRGYLKEKRALAMEASMARPIPAPEEHFVGIAPVGMSMATHATAQEGQRDTATCLYYNTAG